eukprot:CAMPEP_0194492212 /NCGR_PEP_ID=MMETSP0253-20130528/10848_1 /TAXON_ID=2966 /ORGANISM="Noctiluca scintillans" /LENGTH=201 /DNA_ID=CAMNT_0039333049 /DNA_START=50 /DNA_END=655 /DNA_ORIENTATION=-
MLRLQTRALLVLALVNSWVAAESDHEDELFDLEDEEHDGMADDLEDGLFDLEDEEYDGTEDDLEDEEYDGTADDLEDGRFDLEDEDDDRRYPNRHEFSLEDGLFDFQDDDYDGTAGERHDFFDERPTTEEIMSFFDVNEDGFLSLYEILHADGGAEEEDPDHDATMGDAFNRADRNVDGLLSMVELPTFVASLESTFGDEL